MQALRDLLATAELLVTRLTKACEDKNHNIVQRVLNGPLVSTALSSPNVNKFIEK